MQYTLVFDWMFELRNPELSLTEVITYSTIYSFSRDGRGTFVGSYKYLSRLTRLSERQQIRVLNRLINDGLIIKEETPFGYPNEYKVNLNVIPQGIKCELNDKGYDKMSHPMTSKVNTYDTEGSSNVIPISKRNINTSNNKLILDISRISYSKKAGERVHTCEDHQLDFAEANMFKNYKEM